MQEDFPPRHHFERPPFNPHRFEYPQGEFPAGEKPASRTRVLKPSPGGWIQAGLSLLCWRFLPGGDKTRLGSTLEDWTCAA